MQVGTINYQSTLPGLSTQQLGDLEAWASGELLFSFIVLKEANFLVLYTRPYTEVMISKWAYYICCRNNACTHYFTEV